jgi:midasin
MTQQTEISIWRIPTIPPQEPKSSFSVSDGANLLSKFNFDDTKTAMLDLLRTSCAMFARTDSKSGSNPLSKLLIILSDGVGVMNEGKAKVLEMVREAKMQDVFVAFVIVEAADSTKSVLDIRVPVFDAAGGVSFESYMEHFPFPYYIILRDLQNLPFVLSDALRQWFELINA